ncbi:MAG: DUF6055 domain-containing protein [Anaerolineae bacterium]|nr:DUF6055 domain-containing protein [Anaerolineae bacterium]NUQ04791.1 hypothetical protein [Anaerolineae bacterium]
MRRYRLLTALFALLLALPGTASLVAQGQDYDVTLSGSPQFRDTSHFRVHYTLTGVDAVTTEYLEEVLVALEKSWKVQVELLGWAPPPPDDGVGGSDLYDVYLRDLTEDEALGITSPEEIVGDNPRTSRTEEWSSTSYLMVENDFQDISFGEGQDAVTLMRATVAHEFSHALQFAYDYADAHDWIYEATAVWMETQTVGVDQDATGYVAQNYDYPELCFGSVVTDADADRHYGEWLFIDHLAQEFGQGFVKTLWEYVGDYEGFEAVERALEAQGTTLQEALAGYRLRNLARDYYLAELFGATVWLEDTINLKEGGWTYNGVGIEELGANYFAVEAAPGNYTFEIVGDSGALTLYSIGVSSGDVDVFALGRRGVVRAGKYDDLYVMVFNPDYDEDLGECEPVTFDLRVQVGGDLAAMPRLFQHFQAARYAKLENGWE